MLYQHDIPSQSLVSTVRGISLREEISRAPLLSLRMCYTNRPPQEYLLTALLEVGQ